MPASRSARSRTSHDAPVAQPRARAARRRAGSRRSGDGAAHGGATAPNGPSFADVLGEKSGAVQLSSHAKARIERRGISLDSATLSRLQNGVDRAAAKGSRESVVLVDDVAFVVSVKARTVITAVDRASMRDHVFTNIDSAVLS